MLRVQLQDALRLNASVGLDGLKVFLHLEADALPGGEADGVGLELGGGADLLHGVAQGLLHEGEDILVGVRRLLGLLLGVLPGGAAHGGAEGLFLVGPEDLGAELVHLLGEVEDLGAPLLQLLDLGELVDALRVGADGVVDVLLVLRHPGDVLRQGHGLLLRGGVEEQQVLEELAVGAVVRGHAVLQLAAEVPEELLVALPVVLLHPQELGLDLLLQVPGDDFQLPVVLEELPGDVEAQVRGIHHAPDETEVLGQEVGALVHDEDAIGVELQALLVVLGVVVHGGRAGDEEQGLVGDGALGGDGDHALGRDHLVVALLVELVVLLLRDLALLPLPEGDHGVQGLPLPDVLILRLVVGGALLPAGVGDLHPDGEADVVGVLLHEALQGILLEVLAVLAGLVLGVLLDVENDVGADGLLLAGLHGVAVHAVRLPAAGGVGAVLARYDGDVVRDHEGGVEAHAELADDIRRLLAALGLLAELEGAAPGDDAQVVLQLLLVHADAVVPDGEGSGFLVGDQGDGEVLPPEAHLVIRQGEVAELVDGVAGVGDELPEEDLLMGVDGVDHQVQQALGFRLELFLAHENTSLQENAGRWPVPFITPSF